MGELFRWNESYSVGVADFDNDHKTLLSLGNDVGRAALEGDLGGSLGNVLDRLIEYAETHFSKEEQLMQKTGYPDYDRHHREHKHLMTEIRLFKSQFIAGDIQPENVAKFIIDWIVLHIQQEDKKYGDHFNAQGYF